jgi:hypothetical protein
LVGCLSANDEAVLLPQASKSPESDAYKNVAFRLRGDTSPVNPAIFASRFYDGLSAVRLTESDAKVIAAVLKDPARRANTLELLKSSIQSEVSNSELVVGPKLECDADERDSEAWIAGLDATSAFAGVFSTQHSRPPVGSTDVGMARGHNEYFLVVRAGAGVAAQTLHSRLTTALASGATLDACLEDDTSPPGSTALGRLQRAGSRNRARVLAELADALKLTGVASVGDTECKARTRIAVPHIDLQVNTLSKNEETISTNNSVQNSSWRYVTAVDCLSSAGAGTLSNAASGLILFAPQTTTSGMKTTAIRNECMHALPFSTQRVSTERQMVEVICKSRKQHPDKDWIRERFAWQNSVADDNGAEIEPSSLWGSHTATSWTKSFARELAVSELEPLVLAPELVVTAGLTAGKLRAVLRAQ